MLCYPYSFSAKTVIEIEMTWTIQCLELTWTWSGPKLDNFNLKTMEWNLINVVQQCVMFQPNVSHILLSSDKGLCTCCVWITLQERDMIHLPVPSPMKNIHIQVYMLCSSSWFWTMSHTLLFQTQLDCYSETKMYFRYDNKMLYW